MRHLALLIEVCPDSNRGAMAVPMAALLKYPGYGRSRVVRVAPMVTAIGLVLAAAGPSHARPATVTDFAFCNREATEVTRASARPRPAEQLPKVAPPLTDPSGKIIVGAPDALLEGMDATRADDPGYLVAYRECMTRRGVTARPLP
jgi:hypothetical protein